MALEAKAMLMGEMERDLSDKLTAADISTVLSIMADHLARYSMERTGGAEYEDDLLDAYLSALEVQGRSPLTIERYKYIIQRMQSEVKTPTRQITVYHLRRYLQAEKARGISDRTLEGIRQTFSAYFNWLHREGLIESNPVSNLGAIKYQKKTKDLYSDADMENMKFECATIRDRAIICFLRATGCRISEVTALNRDDIDFANLECKVLGKGNKERIVFMDEVAAMTLLSYLNSRTDDEEALFIGKRKNRMTPHGIRQMLVELGKRANVQHVHPHKFRRTAATNLIKHGMPIQEVATLLGHDKLDTTMQYVVLDKSTLQSSYRRYA